MKRNARKVLKCLGLGTISAKGGSLPSKTSESQQRNSLDTSNMTSKWPSYLSAPEDPLENWQRQQAQSLMTIAGQKADLPTATQAASLDEAGLLRSRLPLRGDASCGSSDSGGWIRSFVQRVCEKIQPREVV